MALIWEIELSSPHLFEYPVSKNLLHIKLLALKEIGSQPLSLELNYRNLVSDTLDQTGKNKKQFLGSQVCLVYMKNNN